MKQAESIQRLVDLGFSEPDARTRLRLIERVVQYHEQVGGQAPPWCWFVPGRVEIFGKHTDYAGGRSLLAAVPRGFAVAASPRSDHRVCLRDAIRGVAGTIDPDRAQTAADGLSYVAAVTRRLALNFPGAPLGADVTIASDLPRASGLSSSSALVVGAALALIRRAELDTRPEWLGAIRNTYDLAGYLGALERGSAFGDLAGTHAVGVFGGSEDHTAILTCQPGLVSACRFVPIQPLGDAAVPADWGFVIGTSGVVADKAGGARDLYNRASLAAEALVDLWNRATGSSCGVLSEVLASAPDAAGHLDDMAGRSRHADFPADVLRRRLSHFIAEDGRILEALSAFGSADRTTLGARARSSQRDAEMLLQNQTPATSALAQLAIEEGAFAASSFGAGFGGSVWALAPAGEVEQVAERWMRAYAAGHPHLSGAGCFTARPGPPAFQWF